MFLSISIPCIHWTGILYWSRLHHISVFFTTILQHILQGFSAEIYQFDLCPTFLQDLIVRQYSLFSLNLSTHLFYQFHRLVPQVSCRADWLYLLTVCISAHDLAGRFIKITIFILLTFIFTICLLRLISKAPWCAFLTLLFLLCAWHIFCETLLWCENLFQLICQNLLSTFILCFLFHYFPERESQVWF